MSEMAKHFRKVISSFDPVPNSKMTEGNLPIKILADWARKACDELDKTAEALSTAKAEIKMYADNANDCARNLAEAEEALKQIRDIEQSHCGTGASIARIKTCEQMRQIATQYLKGRVI